MGNNKVTNMADGTANDDAATLGNIYAIAGQAGGSADRNLLINGNFVLNQRGYSSGTATTGANEYTLDRWRVVTSGQSITFPSGTPDVTVTCPSGGLEQVIEDVMIAGGVYCLSWEGTATAKVNGVAITNGGFTSPLTANSDVTIQFASGTVTRAQFEIGNVATPFQRRPIALELAAAQRYYERGAAAQYGYSQPGATNAMRFPFKVAKRTTPTMDYVVGTATNVSVYDVINPDPNGFLWRSVSNADGGFIWEGFWSADAEI
jgi:hypothetical protein